MEIENVLTHVEMVLAKLELREISGGMDYVREELEYEYDAANEFDMPLDFYGDDVSVETNQELGA